MKLFSYKEEESHMIAIVKNLNNNTEEVIRCQYLVGCDGQTLKSSWALADVEIDHELDAHNLAFQLVLAIRNQAVDVNKLLNSYEQERYPVGKNIVSGTDFVAKLLATLNYLPDASGILHIYKPRSKVEPNWSKLVISQQTDY
ncbi:11482_t:CDS:2 [Gigaspora rosea]|nr:11482_t:CDS:2 [Gigaspora rosea]